MYNNQQEALRQGLWNYIGTIMNSCGPDLPEEKKKQLTVALISEEIAKLCKEEDSINLVIAKPILKNSEWVLSNKIEEASKRIDSMSGVLDKDLILKEMLNLRDGLNKAINQIK